MATINQQHPTADQLNSQAARNIVRGDPEAVREIPEPPETMHGIPTGKRSNLTRLHALGVLRRVKRCQDDHPDCHGSTRTPCQTYIWRATDRGYELIQHELEERPLLDCGHPPFANPRGRDGLSCTDDDCDEIYTRAEVREVMD